MFVIHLWNVFISRLYLGVDLIKTKNNQNFDHFFTRLFENETDFSAAYAKMRLFQRHASKIDEIWLFCSP